MKWNVEKEKIQIYVLMTKLNLMSMQIEVSQIHVHSNFLIGFPLVNVESLWQNLIPVLTYGNQVLDMWETFRLKF